MNKDESDRCIAIARRCIDAGNVEKARKFLKKSLSLHENSQARDLLAGLSDEGSSSQSTPTSNGPASSPSSTTSNGGVHRRKKDSEGDKGKEVTSEMREAVSKVKGKKDYYEILGCTKTASDSDLKKAYRKLALALHPDKNCAPGANEAFKAVGNAYAVLSNETKRAAYDRYGPDDEGSGGGGHHHHTHSRRHRYYNDEDISPEDLFNMFFGGMQPSYGNRRRQFYFREERTTPANETANLLSSLIQMSPLILLIVMSMLSSIFSEDPPYSFQRNGNYKVERHTSWNDIKYFVTSDFTNKYSEQKILHFDYDIEREYKNDLQIKCINNSRRKEQLMYQFRVTGNTRYRDYAESMDLQPCTDYRSFKLPKTLNRP